jgi:hypothetical protein
MRELTEEEAAMVSGGATEGAPLITSGSQSLVGPTFGAHRGFPGLFQPMPKLDIGAEIESMIRES